jgi:hypothetical protein
MKRKTEAEAEWFVSFVSLSYLSIFLSQLLNNNKT